MAKITKIMVSALTLVVFGAIFASSAFAECGPGFTNKKQLVHYYQHNPSAAHGFRKELLAHPDTGYQADETVVNWLKSPEQKVFNAPSGYVLSSNTYCPGGAGQYQPYGGLLGNMGGKPMLWHCNKDGKCIPVLKGYCMNFVCGPAVHKSSPKCKCRKPKKPKCKCHHHKHKPKVICKQGTVQIGNGCSPQTVNQRQECEVHSGSWNENTLVCVQVGQNGVCSAQSGVVNGNNNTVNQEVNCGSNTEVCVNNSCTVTVEEKPKPTIMITGKTELNMIPAGKTSGDFYINVNASESGGTLTVDPGIGGVSSCSSSTPEGSITTSVPSGASKECVILYAPEDADKPASMTVTMTANLGSASDQKTETVPITYPARP
jgi:hypothetical protein